MTSQITHTQSPNIHPLAHILDICALIFSSFYSLYSVYSFLQRLLEFIPTKDILTYRRYTQREFKLKFSALLKAYDGKYIEKKIE